MKRIEFFFLDGLHCNHPTEWRHSLYEIKWTHYRTACVLEHSHSTWVEKVVKFFWDNFTNITKLRLPFHFSIYCNTQDTMFMYLPNVRLFKGELRGLSWCFWRVAITILFVFAGCIITELEPHQSATSLRLPWRDVSTICMFFPRVWRAQGCVFCK